MNRSRYLPLLLACGCGDPAGSVVAGSASAALVESGSPAPVESASAPAGGDLAPTVIATAAGGARLVASDLESAYWVDDAARSVMSAPLVGGAAKAVVAAVAPTALLVHGADLYFADYFLEQNEAKIIKVAKAGGNPAPIWSSRAGVAQPSVRVIAVWNGSVYFADAVGVWRVEPGGTDSVVSSMAPSPNLAVTSEGFFVAQRSSLRPDMKPGPGMVLRILADGKPEPLPSFELQARGGEGAASVGPLPIAVAADSDGVYWMDAASSPEVPVRLMALRNNTVKPAVVLENVPFYPSGLLADGDHLYWRDGLAVMRASKSGGDQSIFVQSTSHPMTLDSFTIAGDRLVWIDGARILARPIR